MFKEPAEFDFGHVGLTVVHGLNANNVARGSSKASNPNAAGKSLLFSTLQDLLYREVLAGSSRRDRVTGGKVSLEIGKSRSDKIRLLLSGKKMALFRGKENLGFREQSEIEAHVKGIVPTSLVAYATLCHLDDRVPHPLSRGETAVRREFFTKFFELNSTDNRRKLIASRIADIRASARLVEDKRKRLAALPPGVTTATVKALRAELEEIGARKTRLQKAIDDYGDTASLRQFVAKHRDQLGKVPDEKNLRAQLKALRATHKLLGAHQQYLTEKKIWERQTHKEKAYVEKHGIEEGESDKLEKLIRQYAKSAEDLAEKKKALAEGIAEYRGMKSSLEGDADDPAVCDTCGSALSGKLLEKHIRRVAAKKEALVERKSELRKVIVALKKEVASLEDAAPTDKEIEKTKSRLQTCLGVPRCTMDKPEAPNRIPDNVDRDTLEESIDKVQATLDKWQWAYSAGDTYEKAIEIDDVDAFLSVEDPTKKYLRVVEKMSTLESDLQEAQRVLTERATLKAEIAEAEEELKNAEALELLEKAYGPRGFRKVLINTICQQLEAILNRYAKALFPEDYRFELSLENQFNITVTRASGKDAMPSDVRRLSGAESSMFGILLWCGLMSFIPKARRPNMLILDEVDARLGPDMQERFLSFLPKMLGVVEHVIIVTPKSDVRYEDYVPDTRYITVVKKGLSSVIRPGKASAQVLS